MKAIQKVKWFAVICSALFCVLGAFVIAQPGVSAQVLCYLTGGLSVIYGVSKVVSYFSDDLYNLAFQFDLALGIFVTAVGMVLILHPDRVLSFFPVVIGLFILIDGVFKLQTSVDAKRFGLSNWWLILLGALLCVAMSVLLIFDPFGGGQALMVFIGVSILMNGMENLFDVLYTVKIIKREQKGDPLQLGESDFSGRL